MDAFSQQLVLKTGIILRLTNVCFIARLNNYPVITAQNKQFWSIVYNINIQMSPKFQQNRNKRKYSRISLKRREKLVELIIQNNLTIAGASRRMGIRPSSAKMILNKYQLTGTFPRKVFKSKPEKEAIISQQIKVEEQFQNIIQNNSLSKSAQEAVPTTHSNEHSNNFCNIVAYYNYYNPYFYYMRA